ncbi:zinc-binding domain-containing protein [Aspergillus californicus]
MPRAQKPHSMYPALHAAVTDHLAEFSPTLAAGLTFHHTDTETGYNNAYNTNVMGHFACYNPKCTATGWGSKMIAIRIRMYKGDNKGDGCKYNVRVYHQHCEKCSFLGKAKIDEDSYVERVGYRLRKWHGLVRKSDPVPPFQGRSKKPHNDALCEGCKVGHCKAGAGAGRGRGRGRGR